MPRLQTSRKVFVIAVGIIHARYAATRPTRFRGRGAAAKFPHIQLCTPVCIYLYRVRHGRAIDRVSWASHCEVAILTQSRWCD